MTPERIRVLRTALEGTRTICPRGVRPVQMVQGAFAFLRTMQRALPGILDDLEQVTRERDAYSEELVAVGQALAPYNGRVNGPQMRILAAEVVQRLDDTRAEVARLEARHPTACPTCFGHRKVCSRCSSTTVQTPCCYAPSHEQPPPRVECPRCAGSGAILEDGPPQPAIASRTTGFRLMLEIEVRPTAGSWHARTEMCAWQYGQPRRVAISRAKAKTLLALNQRLEDGHYADLGGVIFLEPVE